MRGDGPHPPTLHSTTWLALPFLPGSAKEEGFVEWGVGAWDSGWSPCPLGIELMISGVKGLPVLGSWVGILRWAQWDPDLSSPPRSPPSAVCRREEAWPLPG